jgi:acetyl-CoA carboxylase carboxyltransferase component
MKETQAPPDTGWKPEADEIAQRRDWAEQMGGAEAVEAHHNASRLTVRERIDSLVDEASFQEVGKMTGNGSYGDDRHVKGVRPAPYVMGVAKINGRDVAVGGEDFTTRGGTSWGSDRRKGGQGGFIEDLAFEYRIPLVNLIDGAGGSVASIKRRGHAVFPGVQHFGRSVELLGVVPVACAVLGVAAGGPAGRAILSHFSVMTRGTSQIFAAGPPVVKRALGLEVTREDLGGAHIAVDKGGTVDNVAANERDAIEQVKRFLSFMPQNVWELPPVTASSEPVEQKADDLLKIVPRNRKAAYNMHKLISLIVDAGSGFEIQPTFGKSVIAMLARFDGHPVGIIANNPMVYGGAMDARAARKQIHFIETCDTFHIPLVFLVDQPGFMVGPQAEMDGTLRDGMRAVYVGLKASVPVLTVVIRKCYGMAGMATCDQRQLNFKVAWPSAEIGNLPIEGGVRAAFRREIERADDPAAREGEIEADLRSLLSPFRMAEAFSVEDMIDPRETRAYVSRFLSIAQSRLKSSVGPKFQSGVRP